jgi:hypothetical protein
MPAAWTDFNVLFDFAPAIVVGQNFDRPRQAAALGCMDRLVVLEQFPKKTAEFVFFR